VTDAAGSDALVVFGVTSDLAFKQIFPALQALARLAREVGGWTPVR
jgi:glucose-6-phosphate 1-dehydrogenase